MRDTVRQPRKEKIMRRLLFVALLAGLPSVACAQPGYGGQDYPPPDCDRPAPLNTMPTYHDGAMPAPPPGGGYHDSYGTADVEADQRAATPPAPPPPGCPPARNPPRTPGKRDPHYARTHYAARIARWRARASACEAGDLAACEGPD
jgi:hypothetical protein